jgi:hypothetical protein
MKIQRLITADELEQETALTDLLLNHKDLLSAFLVREVGKQEHTRLTERLWLLADLLLLDQIFSLQAYKRMSDQGIIDLLSKDPIQDSRFSIVKKLVLSPDLVTLELVQQQAKDTQAPDDSAEIIWRCLAIGSGNNDIQRLAVSQLSLPSIWQLIARGKLPIDTLYHLGMRIRKEEGAELCKIYFDCSRARIDDEIGRASDRRVIAEVTKIIVLFLNFEFLVETTYFERFDELLTKFLASVESFGLKIGYFTKLRAGLGDKRVEKGTPSGELPKGIRDLPLPIQRRLAGEKPYLHWFIGHPDYRIALETLRHIGLNNLEQVLRVPELNGLLLREILQRVEYFTKPSVIGLALQHPKCSIEFARANIPPLLRSAEGRRLLSHLRMTAAANPAVRKMAELAVSRWQRTR